MLRWISHTRNQSWGWCCVWGKPTRTPHKLILGICSTIRQYVLDTGFAIRYKVCQLYSLHQFIFALADRWTKETLR